MVTTFAINKRPWQRASLWLVFLGPFFFLSYGFANWLAEQQNSVGSIVFAWEHHIPFIAWTILPYWVIDILYGISLYVCSTKRELDIHAKRLLTAQVIAIFWFILIPLRFAFERPETNGFFGLLFDTLTGFDKPFNQAPSLHIALLVILWVLYVKHLPRLLLWPFHILSFLIGISVLTTYQHHFIDIPTGLLLGWGCVWLWPDKGQSPMALLKIRHTSKPRRQIAWYYLGGSIALGVVAFGIGGVALWLLWPAMSLLLVAGIYGLIGVDGFQKGEAGEVSLASKWLLFPYLLGARINSHIWTRNEPPGQHIADGVWLGRFPSNQDISQNAYTTIIDLTAEFQAVKHKVNWYSIPCLDLIPVQDQVLMQSCREIEKRLTAGPVLVACALGYSRSVVAVVFWLTVTNRVADVNAAIALVKRARPVVALKERDHHALTVAIENYQNQRLVGE